MEINKEKICSLIKILKAKHKNIKWENLLKKNEVVKALVAHYKTNYYGLDFELRAYNNGIRNEIIYSLEMVDTDSGFSYTAHSCKYPDLIELGKVVCGEKVQEAKDSFLTKINTVIEKNFNTNY